MHIHLLKVLNRRQRELDLTRYRVAKLAGLTQRTVDRVLDGDTDPHVGILEKIARALGLAVSITETTSPAN